MHSTNETTNLKIIRLKTGDDIIAEVLYSNQKGKETYSLINPMRMVYVMGPNGSSISVAMIEWLFPSVSEDTAIEINVSDTLFTANPASGIQEYYWNYVNREEASSYESESVDNPSEGVDEYIKNMLLDIKNKGGKLN